MHGAVRANDLAGRVSASHSGYLSYNAFSESLFDHDDEAGPIYEGQGEPFCEPCLQFSGPSPDSCPAGWGAGARYGTQASGERTVFLDQEGVRQVPVCRKLQGSSALCSFVLQSSLLPGLSRHHPGCSRFRAVLPKNAGFELTRHLGCTPG